MTNYDIGLHAEFIANYPKLEKALLENGQALKSTWAILGNAIESLKRAHGFGHRESLLAIVMALEAKLKEAECTNKYCKKIRVQAANYFQLKIDRDKDARRKEDGCT